MRKAKDGSHYDHIVEILVTTLVPRDKISYGVRIIDAEYGVQVEEA